MINDTYNNFFSNFSNKTKFDIIMSLKKGPLSVTQISEQINEEQSKISHNLSKLTKCSILNVEQKGKQRIYSLNKKTVMSLLKIVEGHVSKYCPCGCEPCVEEK